MGEKDEYIEKWIQKGDQGSDLLRALTIPTLRNSDLVELVKYGAKEIAVIRAPEGHMAVVHSIGGDPREKELEEHTRSMVERLVDQALKIDAEPVGLADVVDSRTGDLPMITEIGTSMRERADDFKVAIMTGENAILGKRVNGDANITGTMISLKKGIAPGFYKIGNDRYSVFDPKGLAIYINSDGIGTKTEFYERGGLHERGFLDFAAMNLDDTIKYGAIAMVLAALVEMRHAGMFKRIPFRRIDRFAKSWSTSHGLNALLQPENVGARIMGYKEGVPCYNMSGSVVSTIDEEMFRKPLVPKAGMWLVAVAGIPNPRSNGITSLRQIMENFLGKEWHKTPEGKLMLQYLAEPSTVLYPFFRELVTKGAAGAVYHMSGGAYDGKLARPLAEHGLFIKFDDFFPPHDIVKKLMEVSGTSCEAAYGKWPMDNDGFVATSYPTTTMEIALKHGLRAKMVGKLGSAIGDKSGVELTAFNGERIYFSGKEAKK